MVRTSLLASPPVSRTVIRQVGGEVEARRVQRDCDVGRLCQGHGGTEEGGLRTVGERAGGASHTTA